jgi:PAS domain S-box-containing protein
MVGEPPEPGPRGAGEEQRRSGPSGTRSGEVLDIHRLLVNSVSDYGIFVLDPTGHVTTWNEGAERIKGYSADEILGRHFSTFYPPDDLAAGKPEMELRVASATGRFEDEGWRVRKDGTLFWANVVITALRDPEGDLVGFAKVTRDLTERRRAELQRLEDARRVAEAEAANRAKSDFLTALSHELRTPLNAIGGYIDLIALGIHGPITDAQRDALERVRTSQQHLLMLITDLLNFSRIEAGHIRYDVAPVPVPDVVRTVRPMIEPQAAARQITFDWQIPDEPAVALGDRGKIDQILLNLVTNAVKYTEPGGRVTVRQLRHGDAVALEVSDTGVGIPADQFEAIFEPFTQVGRSLTSHHEGAGLGLAISRELARAMGGDLVVQSEVGTGSRFTLILPPAAVGES